MKIFTQWVDGDLDVFLLENLHRLHTRPNEMSGSIQLVSIKHGMSFRGIKEYLKSMGRSGDIVYRRDK
jgi:hypothetical protein